MQLGIVIPTYGAFAYAAKAVRSALMCDFPGEVHVCVVDDASPDWGTGYANHLRQFLCDDETKNRYHDAHYQFNGGLTRSWNHGLTFFRDLDCDYICVTNSDVIFPFNWFHAIARGLEKYALVGPLTNAPGTEEGQFVRLYAHSYRRSDSLRDIEAVQAELIGHHSEDYKRMTLNGFCLVAKTSTWWDNAFDSEHVFCPRNDLNSKGKRNPTPLMTLNEYELQRRWRARGLQSAVALGSYVFHYRAVTRGEKHQQGDWVRAQDGNL